MQIKGKVELIQQGMTLPFYRIYELDGRQYVLLDINGNDYISTAYDGMVLWGTNQWMKTEVKDSTELINFLNTVKEFPYPTHYWRRNGFMVDYIGKTKVEGVDTYKVKVVKPPQLVNGTYKDNTAIYYIDCSSYVPVLVETKQYDENGEMQLMRTFLQDYRSVDGLLYPFKSILKYGEDVFQIFEVESVEFNGEIIDQSIFGMPASE